MLIEGALYLLAQPDADDEAKEKLLAAVNELTDTHEGARNAALHNAVSACMWLIAAHNKNPAQTSVYGLRMLQNACQVLQNLSMLIWQDDGTNASYVTRIKDAGAVEALTKLQQDRSRVLDARASTSADRRKVYGYLCLVAKEAISEIELDTNDKRPPAHDDP